MGVATNPPWGADVGDSGLLQAAGYSLAVGQYDSYEVFLERALTELKEGDRLAFLIPDSIFRTEHERTRGELVKRSILYLVKLGEGLFEDVYSGAVSLICNIKKPRNDHQVRCAIITRKDREKLEKGHELHPIVLENAYHIPQSRFMKHPRTEFNIWIREQDVPIIERMESKKLNWDIVTWSGRGVELSKNGYALRCPYCKTWNTMPRKNKDGTYRRKRCSFCEREFGAEDTEQPVKIIKDLPEANWRRVIIGENLHRYKIVAYRYIDTKYSAVLLECPNCGRWYEPVRKPPALLCTACGAEYSAKEVRKQRRVGINYKDDSYYEPPKLVIRKTGRGIYATIDETDTMTVQTVFIFKLRNDRPQEYVPISLYYILGIINSRLMLYYYYKRTAEIEWRSYPYMTQDVIKTLPVYWPDFSDARERQLHDAIAALVQQVVKAQRAPSIEEDEAIERLVRELYRLSPEESTHIDAELRRLAELGTVLASPEEEEEEGDEDEE